ncbi:MAG: malonyl-CoA decarboxylase family protein, partial [Acidocella sp.]|nr:malonyl-CoA decarboxylase family protein [Acidocella sp.]
LSADRRCFGFFHPALPGEPLIFVEVALVTGLAGRVARLLDRDAADAAQRAQAQKADTAIFYSISNCQEGLRGISFGNFLIKQVVEELRAELPQLVQFSTLSPIPGFSAWVKAALADPAMVAACMAPEDHAALMAATGAAPDASDAALLRAALGQPQWWETNTAEALRMPLMRLCARYLTGMGTNAGKSKSRPDPVAKFHLGNGARLERINWLGNPARRGIEESFGLMVNYLYDIASIEANHEVFARDEVVIRSPEVEMLCEMPGAAPKRRRFAPMRG